MTSEVGVLIISPVVACNMISMAVPVENYVVRLLHGFRFGVAGGRTYEINVFRPDPMNPAILHPFVKYNA